MAEIKKNIAQEFGDVDIDTDWQFVYPAEGFSTADGPAADALARANPPRKVQLSRMRSWAGAWAGTGEVGRIYTLNSLTWLCVQDTTDTPVSPHAAWVNLSDSSRFRGLWTPNTGFSIHDVVYMGDEYYRCTASHTSGTDLQQDVDLDRWVHDTLPSHFDVDADDLGINIAPDAVLHAMSYQNHTHGASVMKAERFETDAVYLEFAAGGSERGRVGYDPSHRMVVDAVDFLTLRTLQTGQTDYQNAVQIAQGWIAPSTNSQNMDLGTAGSQFDQLFARQIPSVRIFASDADRDAAMVNPMNGQLVDSNDQLQIRKNGMWSNAIPPSHGTFLSLDDTPGVFASAGSTLEVGRDRAGLVWRAGRVPPDVGDGWEYAPVRAVASTSPQLDATNFIMVDPEDGTGYIVGERFIESVTHTLIPPYSGEESPRIWQHSVTATDGRPLSNISTYLNVAPRYRHGSSAGTLAQWQWAGLAKVTWGGIERRMRAYRDPHTGRNYFAFSQSQVFASPTFGATGTDRIFNLGTSGEGHEEMYDIAVPSPDESHLSDYEIYALVLNKIVRVRFNNDPDSSTLEGADQDTRPAVTVVAEFTRHADQEDIGNRKYFVGDTFEGSRSRGLTWVDNVLFWATNLGVFAIDSYTGARIPELDNIFATTGYPPNPRSGAGNFTHSDIDCAGLAYIGSTMYLLHHEHNDRERFTRSTLKAWDWSGAEVGRFATRVASGATGLPTAEQGVLPAWVTLDDTEQALGAPILESNVIRDTGPASSNPDGYDNLGLATTPSQTIGQGYDKTVALRALISKPLIPAGQGQIDLGHPILHSWRTGYIENLRSTTLSARVAYDASDPDGTGLRISDVTWGSGNFESIRVFPTIGDAVLAVPNPEAGMARYITDPTHRLVELYDGTQWVDIGGEHAGEHADLSAVATDIIPLTDGTYDIGSGSRSWHGLNVQHILTQRIEPQDTSTDILIIGNAGRGVIGAVGTWNFANATVRYLPTTFSLTEDHTNQRLRIRLADDDSTWFRYIDVTASNIANTLYRIDSSAGAANGLVLKVVNGRVTWSTPFEAGGEVLGGNFRTINGGSTASVAFGFDGDDDTGIYSPSVNNIGFVCGGEERMRLNQHGSLVPNPQNVLDDDNPVYALGEDAAHHRWNLFAGTVNYQGIQQSCDRARKFNIHDPTVTQTSSIFSIRPRAFQYKTDDIGKTRFGVVLEELPADFRTIGVDGNSFDWGALLMSMLAELQQLRREMNSVSGRTTTRRSWAADTATTRGTPPPGWNADGTRQTG